MDKKHILHCRVSTKCVWSWKVNARVLRSAYFFLIFLNVDLFFERERQSVSGGGAERERERESERERDRIRSSLQAPSCQHRAQCEAGSHKL